MNSDKLTPEIGCFLRTVSLGTFAAVAAESGMTPSGVSRIVSRLEHRLGATLLYRSTRRLALTPEGEAFLKYAEDMVALARAAEADVASISGKPRGLIRVSTGTAFAKQYLVKILPAFLHAHPNISVDISVTDRRVDLINENVDVAIRVGAHSDSDLVGVRIGTVERVIVASPAYLKAHGTPVHPDDLVHHNCLLLDGFPHQATWPFDQDGTRTEVAVSGSIVSDSAETLLGFAIEGLGILRVGDFLGAEAIADGSLVRILNDSHVPEARPITVLVPPERQHIPRVKAFVSYLRAQKFARTA